MYAGGEGRLDVSTPEFPETDEVELYSALVDTWAFDEILADAEPVIVTSVDGTALVVEEVAETGSTEPTDWPTNKLVLTFLD